MPSYAGEPYKIQDGEVILYQIQSKSGKSPFYFRAKFQGQPRFEGLLANEYADPIQKGILRQLKVIEDPCNPPSEVISAAQALWINWHTEAMAGKPVRRAKPKSLVKAAQSLIEEMTVDFQNGYIGYSKLRRYRGFLTRYVLSYSDFKQPINEIDSRALLQWQKWRDRYWRTGPGKSITEIPYERNGKTLKRKVSSENRTPPTLSTKQKEWVYLKSVFDYAAGEGWIDEQKVIVEPRRLISSYGKRIRRQSPLAQKSFQGRSSLLYLKIGLHRQADQIEKRKATMLISMTRRSRRMMQINIQYIQVDVAGCSTDNNVERSPTIQAPA